MLTIYYLQFLNVFKGSHNTIRNNMDQLDDFWVPALKVSYVNH